MSNVKVSGMLACVLALAVGCGGSATASGSATISEDGVSADANVTATSPAGTVSADASHTTATGGGQVYAANGQQGFTNGAGYTPATTGTCIEEWIHMPILINFPTGGAVVDAQSRLILQELVRSAQTRNDLRAVRVEGHSDRCGNEANNMVLSQQRAEAVAMELVRLGVPRTQIMTAGYGSTQPRANDACDRAHELSRATNRRVEFSLLVCRAGATGY